MKIILEKDSYLDTPIITVQLAESSQPNSSTPHRTAHLQPWLGASLEPSKFAARPDGWIRWMEHFRADFPMRRQASEFPVDQETGCIS
jgi:hypothetical protein